MSVVSADYATMVDALRRCIYYGTNLTGVEKTQMLDVLLHATSNEKDAAATTLDGLLTTTSAAAVAAEAAEDALEAELVTQMGLWAAAGAGDSSGVYTAALAALATLRTAVTDAGTALVAANTASDAARAAAIAGAVITDISPDDILDGRDT